MSANSVRSGSVHEQSDMTNYFDTIAPSLEQAARKYLATRAKREDFRGARWLHTFLKYHRAFNGSIDPQVQSVAQDLQAEQVHDEEEEETKVDEDSVPAGIELTEPDQTRSSALLTRSDGSTSLSELIARANLGDLLIESDINEDGGEHFYDYESNKENVPPTTYTFTFSSESPELSGTNRTTSVGDGEDPPVLHSDICFPLSELSNPRASPAKNPISHRRSRFIHGNSEIYCDPIDTDSGYSDGSDDSKTPANFHPSVSRLTLRDETSSHVRLKHEIDEYPKEEESSIQVVESRKYGATVEEQNELDPVLSRDADSDNEQHRFKSDEDASDARTALVSYYQPLYKVSLHTAAPDDKLPAR